MSQENHTPEMELSTLQAQYQSLQEKFGQQEIVNAPLIHAMLQTGISNFKRRNAEIILTYALLAATACWSWYRLDLRPLFLALSVALFAAIGLFEWLSCRTILKLNIEDSDIQTLVSKMEKARARFTLLWITGVLALCLWLMWFVAEIGEKLAVTDLRSSFVMIAAVLTLSIILVICNIGRLAKLSDELLAQTSWWHEGISAPSPAYHRSGAYWTGVAMLALTLVGLVFKLMHWPFGALLFMAVGLVGVVYVVLTARHLVRALPAERLVVRMSEAASLALVVSVVFKLMHYPFASLLGLVGLALLVITLLVRVIKK